MKSADYAEKRGNMSQYQRMISYLYRYENGVKSENTGYARIELRGDSCRVTVQMRDAMQIMPDVLFFVQKEQGVERIAAGQMKRNGNGCGCRIETKTDNIMNTGKAFTDIDGLLIYINDTLYYATTWKDITLFLGDMVHTDENNAKETESDRNKEELETVQREELERSASEQEVLKEEETVTESSEKEFLPKEESEPVQDKIQKETQTEPAQNHTVVENRQEMRKEGEKQPEKETPLTAADTVSACQCEACRQCPQRGRAFEFGPHIMSMFPKMYPFEVESMGECVRMELKDIGCLPVPYWSLAGNPFLLHGYYCYRHIIFTRIVSGEYCIGVPGIYNKENKERAEGCGFRQFRPLSAVKDYQGAFGYWMYPIYSHSVK